MKEENPQDRSFPVRRFLPHHDQILEGFEVIESWFLQKGLLDFAFSSRKVGVGTSKTIVGMYLLIHIFANVPFAIDYPKTNFMNNGQEVKESHVRIRYPTSTEDKPEVSPSLAIWWGFETPKGSEHEGVRHRWAPRRNSLGKRKNSVHTNKRPGSWGRRLAVWLDWI